MAVKIKLFDTRSKEKREFVPIKNGVVKMYHCGPTVYSRAHIGNLRAYIFADLLRRLFINFEYKIKQVINITDVGHLTSDEDTGEDKIEKASKDSGKNTKEIVELLQKNGEIYGIKKNLDKKLEKAF